MKWLWGGLLGSWRGIGWGRNQGVLEDVKDIDDDWIMIERDSEELVESERKRVEEERELGGGLELVKFGLGGSGDETG